MDREASLRRIKVFDLYRFGGGLRQRFWFEELLLWHFLLERLILLRLAECFFLLDDFLLLAVGFVLQVLHVLLLYLEQVVLVLPL